MNNFYNEKVVLITGGSRGIGYSTSLIFAKNGYNIAINYVSNDVEAQKAKEFIMANYNVKVLLIKGDISREEDVKEIVKQVKDKWGRIDCLVNNAGIAIDTTLEDKSIDNFKKILNVNLIGTFLMSKYVGLLMKEQGNGSIVNVSSTNGIDSYYPYSMDYDASKAGIINLTHNFALEFAPNIRVNSVAPGWTMTDALKEMTEEQIKEECQHILLKRFAEPEEIAEVIYFVATHEYLNDSIIKVDGGRC